ncbi:MAG: apolipoprotein N-acyltransferase [Armatimonadota bacterium]|nr:apolipoprotein N-acyltransferase [Armatimonadota bacterium]MDR7456617.1 apolipoprotein N-acyltransferase [Armatimonadota bacterium]MDR7510742.1 apolipoprotein N-acyltransferase [Armatimonadota bacterium]
MSRPGGVAASGWWRRAAAAGLCGLLIALAFPSADLGWLAWVALVPLLVAIRSAAPGEAFRLGLLAGAIAYGGLVEWIRLFGVPAWAFVTLGMALWMAAFAGGASALAAHYRRQGHGAWLWIVPLTWMAVEWARSVGPIGFPWGLLGLTQHRGGPALGLAAVVGVYGVGGLAALANAAVADLVVRRRLSAPSVAAAAVVGGALVVALAAPARPGEVVRVIAAIQPNVDPRIKDDAAHADRIIDGLLDQTGRARSAGAEIIVYPETAVPDRLASSPHLRWAISRQAEGAIVVAGTPLPGPRNGVLVLGGDDRPLGQYAKRRLVPFGEAGVRPGTSDAPIRTPAGVIGLAVCYESAFSGQVRAMAAAGAEVLAILTNDGWFGTTAGPAQHAAHAVLRAVETGRSVVRAANTGTSMLIRPDGVVVAEQPLGTAGVLAAALPVGGPPTPYVRVGWLLAPLAAAAWVGAALPAASAAWRGRHAAVLRLAAAVAVPGTAWLGGRLLGGGDQMPVVASGLLLVAAWVVAPGRLLDRRGIRWSLPLSLAGTAVLLAAMRTTYAAYGFEMIVGPPDGAWLPWALPWVAQGVAVEAWLRGAIFGRAYDVGGWPLGLALSTGLGLLLHAGWPQEIVYWYLLTSIGFGLLRLWTRDAAGLGAARGLGDAVIAGLASLR